MRADRHADQGDNQAGERRGKAAVHIHHQPCTGIAGNIFFGAQVMAHFAGGKEFRVFDFRHESLRRFAQIAHFFLENHFRRTVQIAVFFVGLNREIHKPPAAVEPERLFGFVFENIRSVRPLFDQLDVVHGVVA